MLKEDIATRDAQRVLPVPHVIRGKLVHGLDPGLGQVRLRTAADLGHEHRMAVIDRADDGLQTVLLAITAKKAVYLNNHG